MTALLKFNSHAIFTHLKFSTLVYPPDLYGITSITLTAFWSPILTPLPPPQATLIYIVSLYVWVVWIACLHKKVTFKQLCILISFSVFEP